MRVRCGRCRTEVEIPGPGTFVCPACGTQNQVRPPGEGLQGIRQPPLVESHPASRVTCDECSFTFAVGDIDLAICPNCRAEVKVQAEESA